MMSDTLFDAVAEIEEYQHDPLYRKIYAEHAPELEVLKGRMRGMALKLAADPQKPADATGTSDVMETIREARLRVAKMDERAEEKAREHAEDKAPD